jgi:hypothetical protein
MVCTLKPMKAGDQAVKGTVPRHCLLPQRQTTPPPLLTALSIATPAPGGPDAAPGSPSAAGDRDPAA